MNLPFLCLFSFFIVFFSQTQISFALIAFDESAKSVDFFMFYQPKLGTYTLLSQRCISSIDFYGHAHIQYPNTCSNEILYFLFNGTTHSIQIKVFKNNLTPILSGLDKDIASLTKPNIFVENSNPINFGTTSSQYFPIPKCSKDLTCSTCNSGYLQISENGERGCPSIEYNVPGYFYTLNHLHGATIQYLNPYPGLPQTLLQVMETIQSINSSVQVNYSPKSVLFQPPVNTKYFTDIYFSSNNSWNFYGAGLNIVPWTINDNISIEFYATMPGVSGLITDYPDRVYDWFKDHNTTQTPYLLPNQAVNPNFCNIISHRGGRGLSPENTLVSFSRGLDSLSNVLESDVQTTKDGYPVLSHDPQLRNSLCSCVTSCVFPVYIHQLTLDELQSQYICNLSDPNFPTQNTTSTAVVDAFIALNNISNPFIVPTLEQLFSFVLFYIDYHASGSINPNLTLYENALNVGFSIESKQRSWQSENYADPGTMLHLIHFTYNSSFGPINPNPNHSLNIQSFDWRTPVLGLEYYPQYTYTMLTGEITTYPIFQQEWNLPSALSAREFLVAYSGEPIAKFTFEQLLSNKIEFDHFKGVTESSLDGWTLFLIIASSAIAISGGIFVFYRQKTGSNCFSALYRYCFGGYHSLPNEPHDT